MKFIVKTHEKNGKTLIAVCDKSIHGSVFEEGDHILDLSSSFYEGEELNEDETGDLIRNADMVNLAGDNSVKLGVEEDIIDEDHIIIIEGIPFAMGVHDSE